MRCQICSTTHGSAYYRCLDCFGNYLLCPACIKRVHFPYGDPFHRIEKAMGAPTNEFFFERAALSDPEIGGVLHCGHGGLPCPLHNQKQSGSVRILDSNGIFTYRVFHCSCTTNQYPQGIPLAMQFLQLALFPATYTRVQTAFTLKVLKLAQLHRFSGKESVWDFYTVMRRWTNNVDPKAVPVSSALAKLSICYSNRTRLRQKHIGPLSPISKDIATMGNHQISEAIWTPRIRCCAWRTCYLVPNVPTTRL